MNKSLFRRLLVTAGVSAFCFVFFVIYDSFSHGVRSVFMTYLFAVPLVLGVLPCTILLLFKRLPRPCKIALLLQSFALSALTVSNALRGVFEIAGTASAYQEYLTYAGFGLLAAAIIAYIAGAIKKCA